MSPRWLMRIALWARNPPSRGRVRLVLGAALLCAALWGIEHWIGWPDWATVDRLPRGPMLRP